MSPEPDPERDTALLRRSAGYDASAQAAFNRLFTRCEARTVRYATAVLADDDSKVPDAVTNAWSEIWTRRAQMPEGHRFEWWSLRIVKNACLKLVRRRPTTELPEEGPAAPTPGPATQIRRREDQGIAAQALASLPDHLRQAIVLRVIEGLAPGAVAEILEISEQSLRKWIKQGLQQLRTKLADEAPAAPKGDPS